MPRKIVDFSARSEFIREEPWDLHFSESSAEDVLAYLRNPRKELARMGIELPEDCRIETVIENTTGSVRTRTASPRATVRSSSATSGAAMSRRRTTA